MAHPQRKGKKVKKQSIIATSELPNNQQSSFRKISRVVKRRHSGHLFLLTSFSKIMESELKDEIKKYENVKVVVENM